MSEQHRPDADACDGCALVPGRRTFVKTAGALALAALIDIGVPPGLAAGMRPASIPSGSRDGSIINYPIPAKDGIQIDKKNEVILVRWKSAMYAFNLSCPHQNTALHWSDSDKQFQCPKHHSKYQPDGTFISGRATRHMDRFSVTQVGEQIAVNVVALHKNDADPKGWSASVVQLEKGA